MITLSTIEYAEQKGMKEERKEGLKERLEKGRKEANEATVRNLKKLGISIPIIMDATGLSAEEIKKAIIRRLISMIEKLNPDPLFLNQNEPQK